MLIAQAAAFALLWGGGKIRKPMDTTLISAASLRQHVEFLAGLPAPRNHEHPASLRLSHEYIRNRFEEMGYPVELQKFQAAGHWYVNVIATLHPAKPKLRVLGAHYDVCGEQQGADDNASGIAGLLEIARLLKAREAEVDHQVRFVAYANEEPPFFGSEWMGSHVHAKSLKDAGAALEVAVVLEMIGYFSDAEGSQDYPSGLLKPFYPSKGNFIAAVSRPGMSGWLRRMQEAIHGSSRIPCETLAAPAFVTGVDFSDHRSYWAHGFDALMITDTAFFRNKNYHEPTDTPDTLDYARMREVCLGVAAFFLNRA